MMPTRRRTRADDRAARIAYDANINEARTTAETARRAKRLAAGNGPPPGGRCAGRIGSSWCSAGLMPSWPGRTGPRRRRLSAELRALGKAVGDQLGRVTVGAGPANSERHRRAVRARGERRDAAWAAARGEGGA